MSDLPALLSTGSNGGPSTLLAAVPLALLLTAGAAQAQSAGTYTGTNNEGDEVQVVVASQSGSLVVTGMSDGGAVYCKGKQASTYGVAVGLSGAPITDGMATVEVYVIDLYYDSALTFKGNSVSGTIGFSVPIYTAKKTPPKGACSAATKPQTFTAKLTSDATVAPKAGTAFAQPIK